MSALPNVFAMLRERWPWTRWVARPWLVVGKGPSFALALQMPRDEYLVLTLNDAVREMPRVAIAHFVDLEALERCAHCLAHVRLVVMPWLPHRGHRAGRDDLDTLAAHHPVIAQLARERRLAWYDLAGAPRRRGGYPEVRATWFSAEAALDLLAQAGARTVRSAGIDGGTQYATAFDDLMQRSRLANGQPRFDRQFEAIAAILQRSGMDYAPLDVPSPVRVFVAASASESLPAQVLAHSIRRHASVSVQVTPLRDTGIEVPQPRDPRHRPRTPFSFQRFLVPQACGYAGRAIYLDADMLVFRDILPLWRRPFGAAPVLTVADGGDGRPPQCSVMLMDCDRLRWDIRELVAQLDAGRLDYEQLMDGFVASQADACIDPCWNALEHYTPGRTALLHYTDMHRQPWVSWANPLGYLWVAALREALAAGAVTPAAVARAVALGHVRPSLQAQLDAGLDDGLLLPAAAKALDRHFRPPLVAHARHGASPWASRALWLRAALRGHYQSSWLHQIEARLRRRWLAHHPGPGA